VAISRAYGVISPFTSFSGGGGTGVEEGGEVRHTTAAAFELLGNYPNPFNPSTTIRLCVNAAYNGVLEMRIYNVLGQLVRVLRLRVQGSGVYMVVWDGTGERGVLMPSGVYFYAVDLDNAILVGKMNLVR